MPDSLAPASVSFPAPPTVVEPTPNRYLDRELSWLAFNARVLEEAQDPANPLIERLRFLTIFHTNLDEFFMIRVSGIKEQIAEGVDTRTPEGLTPRMRWAQIRERVVPLVETAQRLLSEELLPALGRIGIRVVDWSEMSTHDRRWADQWFEHRVAPILTPLAVGPTHPFPFISNLSLNLGLEVRARDTGETRFARVKVPLVNLPRFVPIGGGRLEAPCRVVLVEQIVAANLHHLFPGMEVSEPWAFRVTRDADIEIREDEADDLVSTIQQGLRRRRFGQAIRLEVQHGMPISILTALLEGLELDLDDVQEVPGPLSVPRMAELLALDLPEHKFRPYTPRAPALLEPDADVFAVIRQRDVLLHHPFDSFLPVVEFVRRAARDPHVVAIKQTLYRTSGDSPIVAALEEAVENDKQVAAVVELKARFDEQNNIVWARRLETAGVHVVYGVPGLKTHAKCMLVVRREGDDLVRYAHIGTGNYNPSTARVYTDLGLLTANPRLTADVGDLFNRLTGFGRPAGYRELLVAPEHLERSLAELVAFEAEEARAGRPSRIVIKCNGITSRPMIDALYEASRAGVPIDLVVRGTCALIPGVPGMSETIRVRSVVGRFLEHERVLWFHHGGAERCYLGSADLMERNLERRVEVLTPLLDPGIRGWVRDVLLQRYLSDRARARVMSPDGMYRRIRTDPATDPDVHDQFMASRG
jgi:polyphosphate kinase